MRRSIWWLGVLMPLGVTVAFSERSVSAQTPVESATASAINDTNKAFAQASPPTTIVGRATADAVQAEKQYEAAARAALDRANAAPPIFDNVGRRVPPALNLPVRGQAAPGVVDASRLSELPPFEPSAADAAVISDPVGAKAARAFGVIPKSDGSVPTETIPGGSNSSYQSDLLYVSEPIGGAYNIDYYVWNSDDRGTDSADVCDGVTSGCFWFGSFGVRTDSGRGYLHVGPEHGVSAAGSSGAGWKTQFASYIDGVHQGAAMNLDLLSYRWIRYRIWAVGSSYPAGPAGGIYTTFVIAVDRGTPYVETVAGYVTLPGERLVNPVMWKEVFETGGPCTTKSIGSMYFWGASYLSASVGGRQNWTSGSASYNATCANTNWSSLYGYYGRDDRMVPRTTPAGTSIGIG